MTHRAWAAVRSSAITEPMLRQRRDDILIKRLAESRRVPLCDRGPRFVAPFCGSASMNASTQTGGTVAPSEARPFRRGGAVLRPLPRRRRRRSPSSQSRGRRRARRHNRTTGTIRPVSAANRSIVACTMFGQGIVKRIAGFAGLEEHIRVLSRAAEHRTIGIERAVSMGVDPRFRSSPANRRRTVARSCSLRAKCENRRRNGETAPAIPNVAAWAIRAKSWASWTELAASIAQPHCRQAITSL